MDSWKEGNDIALLLIVAFQFRKLSFASQTLNAQLSNINKMWLKYVTLICPGFISEVTFKIIWNHPLLIQKLKVCN